MRSLLTIFKQCVYSLASSKSVIPKTFLSHFSVLCFTIIQLRNIYEKFALFFFSLLKAKGTQAMKNVQKIAGNGRKMVILWCLYVSLDYQKKKHKILHFQGYVFSVSRDTIEFWWILLFSSNALLWVILVRSKRAAFDVDLWHFHFSCAFLVKKGFWNLIYIEE